MPTVIIKQVEFPLIDTTVPKPSFPDPYASIVFGGDNLGNLVIWRDGTSIWDIPTSSELLKNIPNYITDRANVFISKTDSFSSLIDYRFLGNEIFKIEKADIVFYETSSFTKDITSEIITMNPFNTLLPNTNYLITK